MALKDSCKMLVISISIKNALFNKMALVISVIETFLIAYV